MRRWIIATALAVCGGCNWAFGLDPTQAHDGRPPGQFGFIKMSYLVGPANNAGTQGEVVTKPMPDPQGRFAPLDGAFRPIASYDEMTGKFPYPAELANEQWRFEYTLPGEVPHELQWQPAQGVGHVVAPIVGAGDRTPQNPNTGFEVHPPAVFFPTGTKIFTTGYWTQTAVATQTAKVNLDFATQPPASGGLGATTPGDRIVALGPDMALGDCFQRSNIAVAVAPAVTDKVMTSVTLVNESELDDAVIKYPATTEIVPYGPFVKRLNNALGADQPGTRKGNGDGKTYFGRIAHTDLPAFTTTIDNDGVPAPLMLPLVWCPLTTTTDPTQWNVGVQLRWRQAAYAFVANDRTVSGVRLRSSIATITLKNGDSDDYLIDYPIKIATTPMLGTVNLDLGPDNVMIADAPADLTFAFENVTTGDVDYYEITLYRLATGTLEPVRVYVGASAATTASIRFDPSVMMPGAEYVFAIRTIRGRPMARSYDFLPVTAPQAIATVFTKTFHR